jgi:hypothetical protein
VDKRGQEGGEEGGKERGEEGRKESVNSMQGLHDHPHYLYPLTSFPQFPRTLFLTSHDGR